jgi:hypothetical protein
MLWSDKWTDTMLLESFPQLYSFAKNKDITLQQVKYLNLDELYDHFQLPLSLVAVEQINDLHIAISSIMDSNNTYDKWTLTVGENNFSTKKVYAALVKAPPAPKPFKWIWKSPCLPKHKFFFWLLLQDRLNTRDLLSRKNFQLESKNCVLCMEDADETLIHLFFSCDFSQVIWWKIGKEWHTDLQLINMLLDTFNRSANHFFKIAMMAGCWSIWNHKNKITFDNEQRCVESCHSFFKATIQEIRHRVKPSLKEGMQAWIDTL